MIILHNLSKYYKKYTVPYNSLKYFFLKRREYNNQIHKIENLCVVKELDLKIGRGEIVCIVGRNGAGKSTLAKLIAGTIYPTSGHIEVFGKVVPFLELGVAFHSELNGIDNAIMNGVLLGMSIQDVKNKLNDIFAYAEIEDFKNTPLKFYSSGMLMRLAYSIGMHSNGDIYLFDEILAVGDEKFQRKCFNSFENLIRIGKTIVLITHDLSLVSKYATSVLFLNNGDYYYTKDKDLINKIQNKDLDSIFLELF